MAGFPTHPLDARHMANGQNFEPMRTNNFELQITGLDGNMGEKIMLAVASFTAPNIQQEPITVPYGNSSVKFAGKPTFADTSITCNDFVGIDTERTLSEWQKKAYDYETGEIGYAEEYKKEAVLMEYDTKGKLQRSWTIIGCWISSLNLGQFSQDGNQVRQIECTFVYDLIMPDD